MGSTIATITGGTIQGYARLTAADGAWLGATGNATLYRSQRHEVAVHAKIGRTDTHVAIHNPDAREWVHADIELISMGGKVLQEVRMEVPPEGLRLVRLYDQFPGYNTAGTPFSGLVVVRDATASPIPPQMSTGGSVSLAARGGIAVF